MDMADIEKCPPYFIYLWKWDVERLIIQRMLLPVLGRKRGCLPPPVPIHACPGGRQVHPPRLSALTRSSLIPFDPVTQAAPAAVHQSAIPASIPATTAATSAGTSSSSPTPTPQATSPTSPRWTTSAFRSSSSSSIKARTSPAPTPPPVGRTTPTPK